MSDYSEETGTIEFQMATPKKVGKPTLFDEFREKHEKLIANKEMRVQSKFDVLVSRLEHENTPSIYVGNDPFVALALKKKLEKEGFPILCVPVNKPQFIAITLGS